MSGMCVCVHVCECIYMLAWSIDGRLLRLDAKRILFRHGRQIVDEPSKSAQTNIQTNKQTKSRSSSNSNSSKPTRPTDMSDHTQ